MSITSEFDDVFEEVKGLPPQWEIKFRIDLVESAKPIVMHLRRMAPKEHRELEVQVRDLLGKGSIQRRVSECGAPVVFETKADRSLRL